MPLIGSRRAQRPQILSGTRAGPSVVASDDNGTIQELVAAGVGVALVPLLTVDPGHEGTVVLGLSGVPPRRIGIAWHRDRYRSPAARAFVELAQQVGAQVRRTGRRRRGGLSATYSSDSGDLEPRSRLRSPSIRPGSRRARGAACCPRAGLDPRRAAAALDHDGVRAALEPQPV
jgi:hypothetical protein